MDTKEDKEGFASDAFQEEFQMHAAVKNLAGREFWEAKQSNLEHTIKFVVRFNKKITYKHFIQFQGVLYKILFIDNLNYGNRLIEIKAHTLDKENV